MRRILAVSVLVVAGCSTAPVADFLDLVAPGGYGPGGREEPPPPPRPPARPDFLPGPGPAPRIEDRDAPPPLPPVPAGFRPEELDRESDPPARLRPAGAD